MTATDTATRATGTRSERDARIADAVDRGVPVAQAAANEGLSERTAWRALARVRAARAAAPPADAGRPRAAVVLPAAPTVVPLADLNGDDVTAQVVALLDWTAQELQRLAQDTTNPAVKVSALHRAAAAARARLAVLQDAGVVLPAGSAARMRVEEQIRGSTRQLLDALERRGVDAEGLLGELGQSGDPAVGEHDEDNDLADGREEQS